MAAHGHIQLTVVSADRPLEKPLWVETCRTAFTHRLAEAAVAPIMRRSKMTRTIDKNIPCRNDGIEKGSGLEKLLQNSGTNICGCFMTDKSILAPVISVLNMKGGVGKTTVTAHLFRHLVDRLGKSVLLVDFDPQFNLTQTLMSRAAFEKLKAANQTIFSVMEPASASTPSLFSITNNLAPPPEVDSIVHQLLYWTKTGNTALGLVSGDFRMTKYTLVDDQKALQPVRSRFLEFIENARKKYDLVCIDCNPSSSFMTVCALLASTHTLVPVRPDRYSILGLELLNDFVNSVPILKNKPKQIVLINGSPAKHDANVENTLRADPRFGPITLPNGLKFSTLLQAKEGQIGFATDKRVSHVNSLKYRLSKIVDDLKIPLGW